MKKFALFFMVMGIGLNVFAQNKKNSDVDMVNHEVQMGESIRLLSKRYLVDPAEIYKLNKFAIEGITSGMVLRIPVPRKEPLYVEEKHDGNSDFDDPQQEIASSEKMTEKQPANAPLQNQVSVIDRNSFTNHKVKSGQTLSSIATHYKVSTDEIMLSNPQLRGALKIGQTLKIPGSRVLENNESTVGSNETPTNEIGASSLPMQAVKNHTVVAGETLYSLAKKYDISVNDIKEQNKRVLHHGLKIGQVLTIRKSN